MINRSVNGVSRQFEIKIFHENEVEKLTYSFEHKKIREFFKAHYAYARLENGSKAYKFKYLHWKFDIDWSDVIRSTDTKLNEKMLNAEFAGKKIELRPHIDTNRKFHVALAKSDSGETDWMELSQYANIPNSPGNTGLIISLETQVPEYDVSFLNQEEIENIFKPIGRRTTRTV